MNLFLIKLLLSFLIGATWITSATILAEKFGSKIGGVITGIPSTIVLSLFFIGFTQSPEFAAKSIVSVPVVLGLDALFSALYILYSKRKLLVSASVPLFIWFVLAFFVVIFKLTNLWLSIILFGLLFAGAIILVEKFVDIRSEGSKKMTYTFRQILFRAAVSGTIVAAAVLASKFGGPLLGGVFASFPAIMLSTIIITNKIHGRNFSIAITKVVMISGSLNSVIYALAVKLFYPTLGLYLGTLTSFIISLVSCYTIYRFINTRIK